MRAQGRPGEAGLKDEGWRLLFTPRRHGAYVNDHCVVRTPEGRWHVFGITKPTLEVDRSADRWFCHGSGPSLAGGEFDEHFRVCDFGTLLTVIAPVAVFHP